MTVALHYRVSLAALHSHRFTVCLTIAAPAAAQEVSLPVWIPGSYLVREFAKNVIGLTAEQGGQPVAITQLDKTRWRMDNVSGKALTLAYEVYAFDNSVRTAWLDANRGFFNSTSLCLWVHGQRDAVHHLTLIAQSETKHWHVATGLVPLKINAKGFGTYQASSYDELADCPVEMGDFWQGEFTAWGVPHRFVVAGAPPSFDGAKLLADTQKICEAEIAFWHGKKGGKKLTPHADYLFMLNAVDDGYGGLEHRNSTALICNRRDLPRLEAYPAHATAVSDGYVTLLGLISHEYFHTWNVKALRPANFVNYDYAAENYTQLLWFFEGFTSYYDDILLRRAGLIDDAVYLKLLAKTVNQVAQTPGRLVQSVAQSSFDAWVKYYRVDENTPNITVSYYTKGALVALCFDLTLRALGHSLDAAMRLLWQRCTQAKGGKNQGAMTEADFAAVLRKLTGRDFAEEIAAWVHGTDELPVLDLLALHGVHGQAEPLSVAAQLGLRVVEAGSGGSITLKTVLRGGLAEQAGFAPGDEWLAVGDWRIGKLDDLAMLAGPGPQTVALVARERRLLRLKLTLPPIQTNSPTNTSVSSPANGTPRGAPPSAWRFTVVNAPMAKAWLAP
jgi:predicted metalloprotease with PDZ domain